MIKKITDLGQMLREGTISIRNHVCETSVIQCTAITAFNKLEFNKSTEEKMLDDAEA